jgi:hypothetical protein
MQRLGPHVVAAVMIAVMTVVLVAIAADESDAKPDEAEWITSGYRTFELVTGLAPPSEWETGYLALRLHDWGNKNPPIGKLIIGLAVATFREPGERIRYVTTWPFDHAANLAAGNLPPFHLLTPARVVIALFGGACLTLIYICAVQVVRRRWLPLLAPIVLFGCAVFVGESTAVHTDVIQVALLLAAIVASNHCLASRREWSFFLALVVVGLSCAVKFSTGPLVLALLAIYGVRQEQPKKRFARGLAILIIPFAVFVAVNPYLYPDPIGRTRSLVASWSVSKRAQQERFSDEAVTSIPQRFGLVAAKGVFAPRLATWSAASARIASAAGIITALALLGLSIRRASRRLRLLWIGAASLIAIALLALLDALAVLLPLLTVAGGVHLALLARDRETATVAHSFAIILGTFVVVTALWLPFDWSRYYLPLIALMPVVYVAGIAELFPASRTAATANR